MKRTHLWPYVVLLLIGVLIIFMFDKFLIMAIGFVFCALGTAQLVFHMTVDEHFKL